MLCGRRGVVQVFNDMPLWDDDVTWPNLVAFKHSRAPTATAPNLFDELSWCHDEAATLDEISHADVLGYEEVGQGSKLKHLPAYLDSCDMFTQDGSIARAKQIVSRARVVPHISAHEVSCELPHKNLVWGEESYNSDNSDNLQQQLVPGGKELICGEKTPTAEFLINTEFSHVCDFAIDSADATFNERPLADVIWDEDSCLSMVASPKLFDEVPCPVFVSAEELQHSHELHGLLQQPAQSTEDHIQCNRGMFKAPLLSEGDPCDVFNEISRWVSKLGGADDKEGDTTTSMYASQEQVECKTAAMGRTCANLGNKKVGEGSNCKQLHFYLDNSEMFDEMVHKVVWDEERTSKIYTEDDLLQQLTWGKEYVACKMNRTNVALDFDEQVAMDRERLGGEKMIFDAAHPAFHEISPADVIWDEMFDDMHLKDSKARCAEQIVLVAPLASDGTHVISASVEHFNVGCYGACVGNELNYGSNNFVHEFQGKQVEDGFNPWAPGKLNRWPFSIGADMQLNDQASRFELFVALFFMEVKNQRTCISSRQWDPGILMCVTDIIILLQFIQSSSEIYREQIVQPAVCKKHLAHVMVSLHSNSDDYHGLVLEFIGPVLLCVLYPHGHIALSALILTVNIWHKVITSGGTKEGEWMALHRSTDTQYIATGVVVYFVVSIGGTWRRGHAFAWGQAKFWGGGNVTREQCHGLYYWAHWILGRGAQSKAQSVPIQQGSSRQERVQKRNQKSILGLLRLVLYGDGGETSHVAAILVGGHGNLSAAG